MKQLLILIFIFSFITSCDKKKNENKNTHSKTNTGAEGVQTEKEKDTIYNYWGLVLDTVSDKREFEYSKLKYTLKLNTYSLNDSSIVRNLGTPGSQVYIDHSHTMVTNLSLLTDSIIDHKQIDRTDFKSSLFPEFYNECNLYSTEIDSIIENTIYLSSELAVPDTDNHWRVWYSIIINDQLLGDIDVKGTEYVGL
jgi:hypothetical protein